MIPLSETAIALIQKARIVSFHTWQAAYSEDVLQCFQAADEERRYLTDDDFTRLNGLVPELAAGLDLAKTLHDQVNDIVNEARAEVLAQFPGITAPGGSLYPAERADACWRDFWHFLRCITYGIAGQRTDYTSPEGLHHMQLLYQELQVPLDAMVVGLAGIKQASLSRLGDNSPDLAPYFDPLIAQLKQFRL